MRFTSKLKKAITFCLATVMGAMMLQGCASAPTDEEVLSSMKEFSTADGTASMYFNKEWTVEDVGVDFWLCTGNKTGSEVGMIMQFPFDSLVVSVSGIDQVEDLVEESYSYSGSETEAPTVPGMTNVTATKGKISYMGSNIDAYVVYGETEYAYYALLFASNKMNDRFLQSVNVSCSKFVENAPEIVDNTTVAVTDTITWFNATYAVLTDLNGWDYNRFGGLPANDETLALNKEMLDEWWGVTDRTTADETLDWILAEGHRAGYAEEMEMLAELGMSEMSAEERESFLMNDMGLDAEVAQSYVNLYAMYEEHGAETINGWDYCRAMNLMGYYYMAGYYTEQEALDKSLEIAQTMQPMFESWDDLVESYMRGYEYWAAESADERRAVYEDIKTRSDSPYAVDFKLNLEKTW